MPRVPEGKVFLKPSFFGVGALVEASDRCLLSYGDSHSDMAIVYGDVPYRECSIGLEGEVSSGVSIAEEDDKVNERGHQDVY